MENSRSSTLGVGILGAGPVTQAIHLPTLSRLRDVFHVAKVMDVDPKIAESVAGRVGAAWTTSMDELLADESVQIVVVCSPHQFHAEQVIAACRAGKQAILCEKPFAMSQAEAEQIAAVSQETGVPIIVGAMHTFDPGWLAAKEHWGDLVQTAHTIRYSIVLPPNPRFEDFATEVITRPQSQPRDRRDPEVAASMVRGGIMGLAIHDLPLVRAFCPDFTDLEVLSCEVPDSGGYLVNLRIGDRNVQVFGINTQSWEPEWIFEAIGDDAALRIDFTPSYVQAGSATATISRGGESEVYGPYAFNGYEAEWRFLADLARGKAEPLDVTELIHDLTFALEVADTASAAVRSTTAPKEEASV
ncbi:Gfo/Idh/MocA family protein [Sinomonas terrae]|uniref:Gfo/Idh/MocA family oxidoreductase n=1 Tax=Sinomonas terrae TaxID=2908838 RepID=A0ABS9U5N2_9MICC|nr:Gfo/Idh/MocA family oxidoreductase [Sinomonas terrae]MCH6471991.1 Gfo/Idh/MocA family oxidoreductase [Sinomonas terrae]